MEYLQSHTADWVKMCAIAWNVENKYCKLYTDNATLKATLYIIDSTNWNLITPSLVFVQFICQSYFVWAVKSCENNSYEESHFPLFLFIFNLLLQKAIFLFKH